MTAPGGTVPQPGDAWISLRDPDDVLIDATGSAPAIVFAAAPVAPATPPLVVGSAGARPRVWAAQVAEDTPDPDGARFRMRADRGRRVGAAVSTGPPPGPTRMLGRPPSGGLAA